MEQKKERASRKRPSGEFKMTEIMLENRTPRKESKKCNPRDEPDARPYVTKALRGKITSFHQKEGI